MISCSFFGLLLDLFILRDSCTKAVLFYRSVTANSIFSTWRYALRSGFVFHPISMLSLRLQCRFQWRLGSLIRLCAGILVPFLLAESLNDSGTPNLDPMGFGDAPITLHFDHVTLQLVSRQFCRDCMMYGASLVWPTIAAHGIIGVERASAGGLG